MTETSWNNRLEELLEESSERWSDLGDIFIKCKIAVITEMFNKLNIPIDHPKREDIWRVAFCLSRSKGVLIKTKSESRYLPSFDDIFRTLNTIKVLID